MHKVSIGAENLPVTPVTDGTNQHIGSRGSNPRTLAAVAHPRGFLVVIRRQRHVFKRAQVYPDPLELRLLTNARKDFLPSYSQQLHPAHTYQLVQSLSDPAFGLRKVRYAATQSQRPNWSVDQNHHRRFLFRSAL